MFEERLQLIAAKLARLRELDPNGSVLFGGPTHIYKLDPPATLELVEKYESEFKVTLPLEYREFILQVGNGGGGPYYGLWPIYVPAPEEYDKATYSEYDGIGGWEYDEDYPMFEKASVFPFSADEKYRTGVPVNYDNPGAEEPECKDLALDIGTQGCNMSILLVCTGPATGQVWGHSGEDVIYYYPFYRSFPDLDSYRGSRSIQHSSRTGVTTVSYSVSPFSGRGDEPLSFLDWYEHWLDTGLRWFE